MAGGEKMRNKSDPNLAEPDWEQYWQKARASYRRCWLIKKRDQFIGATAARESWVLLKDKSIKNLLELGGAGGSLSVLLAKRLGLKSEELVLIDKSLQGKLAWQQFSGFGRYIRGDFFTYDFGRQKFDLVLSRGLIEHWALKKDRLKAIRKHAQLSRKYVLIRVPKKDWLMKALLFHQLAIRLVRERSDDGYEKLYTPREIKEEVRQAGLKIIGFKNGLMSHTVLAKI